MDSFPPIPSKWVSKENGTRTVVDRTEGGLVVYIEGRLVPSPGRYTDHRVCPLAQWLEYEARARQSPAFGLKALLEGYNEAPTA
jgi:hypothetical protein